MSSGGFHAFIRQFVTIIQVKPLTRLGIRHAEQQSDLSPPDSRWEGALDEGF